MSLIARCPACATLFRVVPDQLKVSDGWVRCGQCAQVFDAMQTLQGPAQPRSDGGVDGPAAVAATGDPPAAAVPEALAEIGSIPEAESPQRADPEPETVGGEPVFEPGPLPGDEPAEADGRLDAPAGSSAASQAPAGLDAAPDPDPASSPEQPPLQDLAFVRQARRRAFWQRRGVRAALGLFAVSLGLALAGQVAFHHRDRLASQAPGLRPVLEAMCVALDCRLGPPRRIEAIAIEGSAFTRVRADAFRLSVTLANQADIALAMPALELTLTDLQDQPVLRRVLQPADLGPDVPQAIDARSEWASTLTLAVEPAANPARIVGYRLLAFYP